MVPSVLMSAAFLDIFQATYMGVICLLVPESAAFSSFSPCICPGVVYPGLLMSAAFSS